MRKFALPVLALLAVPAISSAAFETGDFDMQLSASGAAPKSMQYGQAGARVGLGYFLTKEVEIGVRQEVSWRETPKSNDFAVYQRQDNGTFTRVKTKSQAWGGSSAASMDYHFDLGAWQPFVGGMVGYSYQQQQRGSAFVAPEVGVKYFVNSTTYVFASVEYDYNLSHPNTSIFSGLAGVGFRF